MAHFCGPKCCQSIRHALFFQQHRGHAVKLNEQKNILVYAVFKKRWLKCSPLQVPSGKYYYGKVLLSGRFMEVK